MIETIVKNYLQTKLSPIPVTLEVINADKYVLIEKTGSGEDEHLLETTFAIQSYGPSLYEAAALNEAVKEAMLGDGNTDYGIIELSSICQCSLNSDYNYTDTSIKKYRYQAVYDLTHY